MEIEYRMDDLKEYNRQILVNIAVYMAEHTICDINYIQIKDILVEMEKQNGE